MIERTSKTGLLKPVGSKQPIRPDVNLRSGAGSKPAARRPPLPKKPKEGSQGEWNEERRPKRPGHVDEYA